MRRAGGLRCSGGTEFVAGPTGSYSGGLETSAAGILIGPNTVGNSLS